jgi:hypothetical protein
MGLLEVWSAAEVTTTLVGLWVLVEAAAEEEVLGEGWEVKDSDGLLEDAKVLDGVVTGELLRDGVGED